MARSLTGRADERAPRKPSGCGGRAVRSARHDRAPRASSGPRRSDMSEWNYETPKTVFLDQDRRGPVDDTSIACPQCGSHQVYASRRGWNILTGIFGMSAVVITCLKCGYRFKPGNGRDAMRERHVRWPGVQPAASQPAREIARPCILEISVWPDQHRAHCCPPGL
jgi:hypothetical protein